MSEAQVKATPRPWTKEYDNDTGPDDEGFCEWIQVGPAKIALPRRDLKTRTQAESDADLVFRAVNSHDKLLEALKAAHKLLTAEHFDTSDELVSRCEEIAKLAEAAIQSAEEEPNARNQSE